MAWLDDRAWAHPKLTLLSDAAFRVWVSGVCYSAGFGTSGRLEPEHQRLIGATPKLRAELVNAGLWDDLGGGAAAVHDWSEHNDKRDARRSAARDRKRKQRDKERDSERDKESDDRRDGNAVKEVKVVTEVKEVLTGGSSTSDVDPPLANDLKNALAIAKLLKVVGDVDEDGLAKIRGFAARLPEGSLYKVAESVRIQRPTNRVGYAIAALSSELRESVA